MAAIQRVFDPTYRVPAQKAVRYLVESQDVGGGWCYGPRFLCETMPVLCLLFAVAYSRLRVGWQQRTAAGLVAASVAIHLVGMLGYGAHPAWNLRHELPDQGRCLFSFQDTQIEAHTRAVLGKVARFIRGGP